MSNSTITTTESTDSITTTDDPAVQALSEAYQADVIDEETYGDLVEHRLEAGLETRGRAELHDRLGWAGVYTLVALAAMSVLSIVPLIAAGLFIQLEYAGFIGFSVLGFFIFGMAAVLAFDVKTGGASS